MKNNLTIRFIDGSNHFEDAIYEPNYTYGNDLLTLYYKKDKSTNVAHTIIINSKALSYMKFTPVEEE